MFNVCNEPEILKNAKIKRKQKFPVKQKIIVFAEFLIYIYKLSPW